MFRIANKHNSMLITSSLQKSFPITIVTYMCIQPVQAFRGGVKNLAMRKKHLIGSLHLIAPLVTLPKM